MIEAPLRFAAMDLGTNSFHMIVASVNANGNFTVIGREKEVVRLGAGAGTSEFKHLQPEAMERAVETLRRFKLVAENHQANIRAIATSAVREAINRDLFIQRVAATTGIEIEVVSGFEEARLIYLGVMQALPVYEKTVFLVDVGGGSTEFLVGHKANVLYANSLKLGTVRFTQRFFSTRTLRNKQVEECRRVLRGELDPIHRSIAGERIETAIGSSGTVLSIAAMIAAAKTPSLDTGVIMRDDLAAIVEEILRADTVEKRKAIPGLDANRADIIVAGALILEQVFGQFGLSSMQVSKYALREGILLDSIQKLVGTDHLEPQLTDIRRSSVLHWANVFRYEEQHAHNVWRYAAWIFDQTAAIHGLGETEREYLEVACLLHDVGYHVSHAQHHRHSYYLIRNAELLGFTEHEIEVIANIARYHRKSHPANDHPEFARLSARDRTLVRKLASILRIADGLDRRHNGVFHTIRCRIHDEQLAVQLVGRPGEDSTLELWGVERRKALFEETFNLTVECSISES